MTEETSMAVNPLRSLHYFMLAEAGIYAGRNVTQSQSYGPEARGGASRVEVINNGLIRASSCEALG